jgi:hypothetical protein
VYSPVCFRVTEFNKQLVDKYLDIPYVETKCGYACSDQLVSLLRVARGTR